MAYLGTYIFGNPSKTKIIDTSWQFIDHLEAQKIYAAGYNDLLSILDKISNDDFIACPFFSNQYGDYMSVGFKGKAQQGETLIETSQRELTEESGLKLVDNAITIQLSNIKMRGNVRRHIVVAYRSDQLEANHKQYKSLHRDLKHIRAINIVYGSFAGLVNKFSEPRSLLDNEDGCIGAVILSYHQLLTIIYELRRDHSSLLELNFDF